MSWIVFLISLVIVGALLGALGRLAVPGPNPMSIGMTILVGIGGAFLGGVVAQLLGATGLIVLILQALGAALIVFIMQRRGGVRPSTY